MSMPGLRVQLIDAPDETGRTTSTLVASLAARLATLYAVSGAAAVGSMVAGFAAIGREASRTAEGAKLRQALSRGRVVGNGEALWITLRIRQWASLVPAAPLIEQLRNDLALLLAPNLQETLQLLPIPGEPAAGTPPDDEPMVEFLDCLIGMWAFSKELTRAIDALVQPTIDQAEVVRAPRDEPPAGEILR
ncbi:MAG: hypothetical protein ACREMX_15190 [Gemmatimonadales bacterium]